MNWSLVRRRAIYAAGAFFYLVIIAQLFEGLGESEGGKHRSQQRADRECVNKHIDTRVSPDGYLEGIAVTNCESGNDIDLSYHVYDHQGRLLEYEGIRFPSTAVDGKQVGFFRIPLDGLKHFGGEAMEVRFDWVRDRQYWFSRRYAFAENAGFRLTSKGGVPAVAQGGECRLVPLNFRDGQRVEEFEKLNASGAFRVSPTCPVSDDARLTYHLLDENGAVLRWDVAHAQHHLVCTETYSKEIVRLANTVDLGNVILPLTPDELATAARRIAAQPKPVWCGEPQDEASLLAAEGALSADVNPVAIWGGEEPPAAIVFDVIVPGDAGAAFDAPVIDVDTRIDRLSVLLSVIPRILPANDYVLIPAWVKVEREAETPTPFRIAMEVFEAHGAGRYETERNALSMNPDNVYQFRKLSFRAPPAGVWNLNVGFVFDPYMWYSYIFPEDSDRVVFINPLVFMLLVLLSLFLVRGLLRFWKEEPRWFGKVLALGAIIGVVGLFSISAILTIAGLAALTVFTMLKLARMRTSGKLDSWLYFVLLATMFGVLMEGFWSVYYAGVYRHGVMLSAVIHGAFALLVVAVIRRDVLRRALLGTWFLLAGTFYVLVVSYLKFFGEPPRYSIYQYAGQAMDVADSALVLFAPREWLGLALIIFSTVLVLVTRERNAVKFSERP